MSKNLALAIFIVITWASAFPIIAVGVREVGGIGLPALRFFVSALISIGYLLIVRPPLPSRQDFLVLAFAAFFNMLLYQSMLNYGQLYVQSGLSSFIVNTNPLTMILLAVLIYHEKAGKFLWLGTAVALLGLCLIALSRGAGEAEFNIFVPLIALAGCFAAIGNVVQKPLFARNDAMTVATWAMVFGGIFFLPFLPDAFARLPTASATTQWGVLYLGIFPAFLAQSTFVYLMREWGAARSTALVFAVPPVALVFGMVFLGQIPALQAFIGACFTLAGVYLAMKK